MILQTTIVLLISATAFSTTTPTNSSSPANTTTPSDQPFCPFLELQTTNASKLGICCRDASVSLAVTTIPIEDNTERLVFRSKRSDPREASQTYWKCARRLPLKVNGVVMGRCCLYDNRFVGEVIEVEAKIGEALPVATGSRNLFNAKCNEGYVYDANGDCVEAF